MTDYTVAAARAAHTQNGGDTSVIPEGCYCYVRDPSRDRKDERGFPIFGIKPCPYWARNPEAGKQQDGFCAHLDCGDWEEDGTMLLWDMVKECGLKDDFDIDVEEDEAADNGTPLPAAP